MNIILARPAGVCLHGRLSSNVRPHSPAFGRSEVTSTTVMQKKLAVALFVVAQASPAMAAREAPVACKTQEVQGYQPGQGIVPTANVAIAIARPVIVAAYGKASMRSWEPLSATSSGNDWEVVGHTPKDQSGGQVTLRVSRCTGRVSFLYADK